MDEIKRLYLNKINNMRAVGEYIIKKAETMSSEYSICDLDINMFVTDVKKLDFVVSKVLDGITKEFEELETQLGTKNEEDKEENIKENKIENEKKQTKEEPKETKVDVPKPTEVEEGLDANIDDDYEDKMNSLYADDII